MSNNHKDQKSILKKLGIEKLNPMQQEAAAAIDSASNILLLSPTGTGKTLAFLLPIIDSLDQDSEKVQVLILTPSRELALQIESVLREMGTGFKANAVYGGRPFGKDKIDLAHAPAILIGTPGRIADHFRRETIDTDSIKTLVLDEFDKSLEVGFETEMREIVAALPKLKKKILTSATQAVKIPAFVGLKDPKKLNFIAEKESQLKVRIVESPTRDKLETLVELLSHIGNAPGIIFCNLKDTIEYVSDYLYEKGISHGCFFGGMEQIDRERALIMFRNGTNQVLIATDLAARGIDVPEMKFIIHYQLPFKEHEFTHRNGRTARMNAEGTAYLLLGKDEKLPDYINISEKEVLKSQPLPKPSEWETLYISGGRKDKISKGDIAGLFFKQGKLLKDQLGVIELKQDCSYVAVPVSLADNIVKTLNNSKLKNRKVRISILE
ncbi:DEAD/DEAH box helicase [Ulvibacter antarcticus]|uniref:Superfamily II DNA/RNA helicase n=1 Tax=Ulvibacter antarcticus TaxID=442714 RepID=A0A3L9YUI7_9FLAO|nr:DEAD/DEAH box helicase [Ulvibacter antarcticus]RMA64411.1 superfamily II DNA/RNA helicase [Ulvibacter antarcticus]